MPLDVRWRLCPTEKHLIGSGLRPSFEGADLHILGRV